MLLKCFYSKDRSLQCKLFITFVRPILEFNSSIWSPHLVKDITAIERVQKYFTKNLKGLGNKTYKERLAIFNLNKTYKEHLAILNLNKTYKEHLAILNLNKTYEERLAIFNLNKTCKERLAILNLPSFKCRRVFIDLVSLYKIIHGLSDNKLQQLFSHTVLRTPMLLRRHPHQLDLSKPRSDLLKFSFRYRAVKLWNALPEHIVAATSITTFKHLLLLR